MKFRILAPLLLAVFAGSTSAAPITLHLTGSWESVSSGPNLSITATFDDAALDQDPNPLVGSYQVESIAFGFEQLGKFASPFNLVGDPARTTMHLYPSSTGSPTGEVRLFGSFASSPAFPNAILPLEFDLRMTFSMLDDDALGSLASVGALLSSTLYVSDQIGARSSSISAPVATFRFSVPEPDSAALLAIAFGAVAWGRRRVGKSG